jgi:hypothetical protein
MRRSLYFIVLVSFITIGCISNANQVGAVYLIPTGFEGPVVIIYDQAALAKPPIVDVRVLGTDRWAYQDITTRGKYWCNHKLLLCGPRWRSAEN